jgi:two-component system sensor histidine kinase HydH
MNFRNTKLSRMPALWIIAAVMLFMVLLGYYAYANFRHEQGMMVESLSREGQAFLQALEAGTRASLSGPMWEKTQFEQLLNEIVQHQDVLYLQILDENGHHLMSAGQLPVGSANQIPSRLAGREMATWMEGDEKVFVVARWFDPLSLTYVGMAKHGTMAQRWHGWCRMMETTAEEATLIAVVGLSTDHFLQARHEDIRRALGTGAVLLLFGGAAFYFLMVAQRNQTIQKTLEETRTYSQNVVESISNGVFSVDKQGSLVSLNSVASTMFGISPAEALHRHYCDLLVDGSCRLEPTIERGERILEKEMVCRTLGGKEMVVSVSASQLKSREGEVLGAVVVLRDLHQIRSLENQLRRSERLASMGQMVAGIAHELRNPLSSLRGVAKYFERKYGTVPEDSDYANLMIQEVDRLNRVITDLLRFAQPVHPRREEIILKAVVDHALRLCSTEIEDRGINVEQDFADDLPDVQADSDLLVQALVNLFLNAVEAMKDGGHLKISLGSGEESIEIMIADDGTGISSEEREHIFDPFFTTKPGGTGLGLAIVHSIVEAHSGKIYVDSAPGKGTTFRIELPARG